MTRRFAAFPFLFLFFFSAEDVRMKRQSWTKGEQNEK